MSSTHVRDMPARERMLRGRSLLFQSHPFYAALSLNMELRERPAVPTAQVDGKHLDYNPAYISGLNEPQLLGLIAHETKHIALLHHCRRGGRDPDEWNISCDLAINQELIDEGFTLPKGGLLDPSFKGMGAEQIYAERQKRKQQNQPPEPEDQDGEQDDDDGQDQAGGADPGQDPGDDQGGGAGPGQGPIGQDPGMCGGVVDAALDEGESVDQVAAETEAMVRQCAAVTAAGAGAYSDALGRLLAELNQPRVNWREEFARFIDDTASSSPTWTRPDKRFLGSGFYLPSRGPDSVSDIVAFVDTSGSIQKDAETAFATEVQAMLDTGRVARVHVVSVDEVVRRVDVIELGDEVRKLTLQGGHGTRFDVAYEWLAENVPDAAAVVYLTDLDVAGNAWGVPPPCPVLWCVTGRLRRAPFGEIIPLDPYQ